MLKRNEHHQVQVTGGLVTGNEPKENVGGSLVVAGIAEMESLLFRWHGAFRRANHESGRQRVLGAGNEGGDH